MRYIVVVLLLAACETNHNVRWDTVFATIPDSNIESTKIGIGR